MLYFTMMGGSEIRLWDEDNVIVTISGSTEVLLPTVAEKMVRIKKNERDPSSFPLERRVKAISLMGAIDWKRPTIAREIEEMFQLKGSGLIAGEELVRLWKRVTEEGDMDIFETITFMGWSGEDKPGRKEEIKAMEGLCLKGLISSEELDDFRKMIDGNFSDRRVRFLQEKLSELMLPSDSAVEKVKNSIPLPQSALE
jgi:hypothetical protein